MSRMTGSKRMRTESVRIPNWHTVTLGHSKKPLTKKPEARVSFVKMKAADHALCGLIIGESVAGQRVPTNHSASLCLPPWPSASHSDTDNFTCASPYLSQGHEFRMATLSYETDFPFSFTNKLLSHLCDRVFPHSQLLSLSKDRPCTKRSTVFTLPPYNTAPKTPNYYLVIILSNVSKTGQVSHV